MSGANMTRREYFAGMMMQMFMRGAVIPDGYDATKELQLAARRACEVADVLLAELSKEPQS